MQLILLILIFFCTNAYAETIVVTRTENNIHIQCVECAYSADFKDVDEINAYLNDREGNPSDDILRPAIRGILADDPNLDNYPIDDQTTLNISIPEVKENVATVEFSSKQAIVR